MPEEHSVLIVEDNDFVRMQIASYLKEGGYGVREAPGGNRALDDIAAEGAADLIIADVRMEPMGGFEFIKILRSQNVETPVILVTGDQTPDMLEQAARLGCAAVLMKPVDKARLLTTVMRSLKGHKRA